MKSTKYIAFALILTAVTASAGSLLFSSEVNAAAFQNGGQAMQGERLLDGSGATAEHGNKGNGTGERLMDGSHAGQGSANGQGNGTRLMDGSGAGSQNGQGLNGEGANFVDADGDGVCDTFQNA